MSHPRPPVLRWFRYATLLPVLALTAACGAQVDEQVTIDDCDTGASAPPAASSSSAPGAPSASPGGGANDGGSNPGDAGAAPTGQSLSTGPADFCVVAPWTDAPQQFVSSTGATTLPGGTYTLRYVGGAQNHDEYHLYGGAYEVTAHYPIDGLEAGHHLYDGADPYSSTTSVWLDASGLVGDLPDVASVEKANAGHTWPITLAGGPLNITYYDNDYSDNIGPGTQLCIDTSSSPPDGGAPTPAAPRIAFFGSAGTFDETSLLAFLQAYPATVTRLDDNAAPVTAQALGAFDIVILDALERSFDATEAAAFAAWIHGGGSVMSLSGFTGTDPDWSRPNSLLADLPIQYVSGLLPTPPGVVTDFASHPVTTGLHDVTFLGGYQVVLNGQCDGATQDVALFNGAPVGAACDHGSGRVYLWGDEWVEYSSQWTSSTDVQQFWQDAIDWLSHKD